MGRRASTCGSHQPPLLQPGRSTSVGIDRGAAERHAEQPLPVHRRDGGRPAGPRSSLRGRLPDGPGVRDHIHVVDVARGHLAAVDFLACGAAQGSHLPANPGCGRTESTISTAGRSSTCRRRPERVVPAVRHGEAPQGVLGRPAISSVARRSYLSRRRPAADPRSRSRKSRHRHAHRFLSFEPASTRSGADGVAPRSGGGRGATRLS